jgi:WD40 repeat protein
MEPEIVVNLWVFIQNLGPMEVIHELGVRPYMMKGSDDEMTRLLKILSVSDFHFAQRYPLPDRYYLETSVSDGTFRAITGDEAGIQSEAEKKQALEAIQARRPARRHGLALVNPQISGMKQMEYFKEALDAMQASLPARRLGIDSSTTRTQTVNRRNLLSVITRVIVDEQGNQVAQVDDPRRSQPPSAAVNLWMFHDEKANAIYAVSGRGYMVHGSESDQARVLKALAPYDFSIVEAMPLPEALVAIVDGQARKGVLAVTADDKYEIDLFSVVFHAIDHEIPTAVGIDRKTKNRVTTVASQSRSIATRITERERGEPQAISVQIASTATPRDARPSDNSSTGRPEKADPGVPRPNATKITTLIKHSVISGHTRQIVDLAVSPEGNLVLSASEDGDVKVWDAGGHALRTLRGDGSQVCGVAVSADGTTAVSAGYWALSVWDVQSGRELRRLKSHNWSGGVAFSANGKLALSASIDGHLSVWDVQGGRELLILRGGGNSVGDVSLNADGKVAVSGYEGGKLMVWDVGSEWALRTIDVEHTGSVKPHIGGVALSTDGKVAISGSWDGTAKVWDIESGAEIRTLRGHTGQVNRVALSADAKTAASASDDCTVKIWDVGSGTCLTTFSCEDKVRSCALGPDIVVAGDTAGRIYFLDIETKPEAAMARVLAADNAQPPSQEALPLAGTIRSQQIKFRDEMLALPIPPEADTYQRPMALACNGFANVLALEPVAQHLAKITNALEETGALVSGPRFAILSAMLGNYKSALSDPLIWWTVDEVADQIQKEPKNAPGFIYYLGAVGDILKAVELGRIQGTYQIVRQIETADIPRMYAEETRRFQAGLLMAHFGGATAAFGHLAKWFPDCDIASDRQIIEAYVVAAKSRDDVAKYLPEYEKCLERWNVTEGEALQARLRRSADEKQQRQEEQTRLEAEKKVEDERKQQQALPPLPSSVGSIFKRQTALRDELLALPIPSDTSCLDHTAAAFCNNLGKAMAMDPSPKRDFVETLWNGVGEVFPSEKLRCAEPHKTRLRILDTMHENYKAALGDPLNFRAPAELDLRANSLEALSVMIQYVDAVMGISKQDGSAVEPSGQILVKGLCDFYEEYPLRVQAALLVAHFSGSEPALTYLENWFSKCDLKADLLALEAYFEEGSKTHQQLAKRLAPALERWKAAAPESLQAEGKRKEHEMNQIAENVRVQREEVKGTAEDLRRQREPENKLTQQEPRVQDERTRAAAGLCILCGKPLPWTRRLFGAKQHKRCSVFSE